MMALISRSLFHSSPSIPNLEEEFSSSSSSDSSLEEKSLNISWQSRPKNKKKDLLHVNRGYDVRHSSSVPTFKLVTGPILRSKVSPFHETKVKLMVPNHGSHEDHFKSENISLFCP